MSKSWDMGNPLWLKINLLIPPSSMDCQLAKAFRVSR
jgi:hypothetical protein